MSLLEEANDEEFDEIALREGYKYLLEAISYGGNSTLNYKGFFEIKVICLLEEYLKVEFLHSENNDLALNNQLKWFNRFIIQESVVTSITINPYN